MRVGDAGLCEEGDQAVVAVDHARGSRAEQLATAIGNGPRPPSDNKPAYVTAIALWLSRQPLRHHEFNLSNLAP